MKLEKVEWSLMESRMRTAFINCLSGIQPANVVATICKEGNMNAAIFNSVTHIGANPPLLGMIFRPTSTPRHTYHNWKETGYCSINHVFQTEIRKAHYTAARFESDENELDLCGLSYETHPVFGVPWLINTPCRLILSYREEYLISANQTLLAIGELVDVEVATGVLRSDGTLNLETSGSAGVCGLDDYYALHHLDQLAYAKPHEEVNTK